MAARTPLLAVLSFFVSTVAMAALPPGWVGRETCATCHEDAAAAFVAGEHGRAIAARGAGLLRRSCESCHGAGETHANDPSRANIRTGDGPADVVSKGCLECHAAQRGGLAIRTPAHERAHVTCLDCHVSGHRPAANEPLLKRNATNLCSSCHASERAEFDLPFAHREGRHPLACTSCHSVHGGTTIRGHIEEDVDERCVACHEEEAGPFVYEHPPREVGGCVSCHRPHGSPNPKLLTRADVAQLCLECHTDTPSFHDVSQPVYRNCTACHAAIHGSQRDPGLFDE